MFVLRVFSNWILYIINLSYVVEEGKEIATQFALFCHFLKRGKENRLVTSSVVLHTSQL
jgi:hypothetical protein